MDNKTLEREKAILLRAVADMRRTVEGLRPLLDVLPGLPLDVVEGERAPDPLETLVLAIEAACDEVPRALDVLEAAIHALEVAEE